MSLNQGFELELFIRDMRVSVVRGTFWCLNIIIHNANHKVTFECDNILYYNILFHIG